MDTLKPFPTSAEANDSAIRHELVARRAHEIWCEIGRPEGCDLAIWLEAEAEITALARHTLRHPRSPVEQS